MPGWLDVGQGELVAAKIHDLTAALDVRHAAELEELRAENAQMRADLQTVQRKARRNQRRRDNRARKRARREQG